MDSLKLLNQILLCLIPCIYACDFNSLLLMHVFLFVDDWEQPSNVENNHDLCFLFRKQVSGIDHNIAKMSLFHYYFLILYKCFSAKVRIGIIIIFFPVTSFFVIIYRLLCDSINTMTLRNVCFLPFVL